MMYIGGLSISVAGVEDIPAVCGLMKMHADRLGIRALLRHPDGQELQSSDLCDRLMHLMEQRPVLYQCLLARNERREPVGYIAWHDAFSSWRFALGVMIRDAFVIDNFGPPLLGKALVSCVEAIAIIRGRVRLETGLPLIHYNECAEREKELFKLEQFVRQPQWLIYRADLSDFEKCLEDFDIGYRERHQSRVTPWVNEPLKYRKEMRFEVRNSLINFVHRAALNQNVDRSLKVSWVEATCRIDDLLSMEDHPFRFILARIPGRRISVAPAFMLTHDAFTPYGPYATWWIEDMYSQVHRGGYGYALCRYLCDRAKEENIRRIETRVLVNSFGARVFFKSMGLIEDSNPKWIIMCKDLTASYRTKNYARSKQLLDYYKIKV